MSASNLMMRPVILSSPENVAFLLTILLDGGSVTTSSPGCKVAAAPGTLFGWRWPGGPGSGLGDGAAPCPGCGGATATGAFCGTTLVPGGGASGCDCTAPGGGTPCPGGGRFGAGSRRPCGSSGPSSSSSGCCCCCTCWPRPTLPGGRGAGSEKTVPSCARAGGAASTKAAIRAAKQFSAMVRSIRRGTLDQANQLSTLYRRSEGPLS